MKKLILSTALIAISLQGNLYAQNDYISAGMKRMSKSKTELTFNANENMIFLKDFVVLKEGRMILELCGVDDYESFRNLDSLLRVFRKDIAFYKDSLDANPTGHVRIDYAMNEEYPFKKIRFKKYEADGSIFLNQAGDISKLKFDQDTIRLIIQKSRPGIHTRKSAPCSIPYSIQATFILGNYYDIDKVVADNVLKGIVDTLEKASQLKKTVKSSYVNPLSIVYNPYYTGKAKLQRYEWLIKSEYDVYGVKHSKHFISVDAKLGAGLIRNTMAPTGEIGIQYNKYVNWNHNNRDFLTLFATPYFFFDKNVKGDYQTNDNWFINADIGSVYESNEGRWLGKMASFGVGYLVVNKGGYFKNTTMKVFTDLQVRQGFTIVPEFIFTDNFKQIFPGFTVKVF